ncbi:unnamed protein product [Gongylonema pulchrum]|uniref:Metalloendopeptidase n=1 Tax=Gongylonema pulchrum TaxID=637853 RepID=A0A183DZF2_9BILA|nr:unnamed protein product [Gongylonema pulchrum]
MSAIEKNTCIRLRKRSRESSFLDLRNVYGEGCYTSVGRLPGRNVVMLEANNQATCMEYDIVLHELLHAVGLWHEHMRSDRDQFIKDIIGKARDASASDYYKVCAIYNCPNGRPSKKPNKTISIPEYGGRGENDIYDRGGYDPYDVIKKAQSIFDWLFAMMPM